MKRKLISQTEACDLVGISRTAFRNWGLKPAKRQGRFVLYDRTEVLRAASARQLSYGLNRRSLHEADSDDSWFDYLCKDLMSEVARDAAYLIVNALRERNIEAEHIAEIAGCVLLVPSIASERHGMTSNLDAAYANSGKRFMDAVRKKKALPKSFPMLTEGNPFAEWLQENDPESITEIVSPPPQPGSTDELFEQ